MMMLFQVVMPARPGPADARHALAASLAPAGHWCLMLMMLLLWVARPRSQDQLMPSRRLGSCRTLVADAHDDGALGW